MTTTPEKAGLIFKKIPAIMCEIPSIGKDRKNTGQGYNFRGIDDVYNFVQPLLAKHGVFMSAEILADRHEERTSRQGSAMMYRVLNMRYSFVAEDGSSVSTDAVGEGMDSGDKASAKAMSIAQKYAILQMFLVPTEEAKDPENDNPEVKPKAQPKPPISSKSDYEALKAKPLPRVKDEFEGGQEPPAAASLAAFSKIMAEFKGLGVSEETAWTGIHRFSTDTFKKAVVEVSDFTTSELDAVNGYLNRKLHATKADRAKKDKS
jgi:hypothetical protein